MPGVMLHVYAVKYREDNGMQVKQVCWGLRTALNITLDQAQFKSNQKSFWKHTEPYDMVITLARKRHPTKLGLKKTRRVWLKVT